MIDLIAGLATGSAKYKAIDEARLAKVARRVIVWRARRNGVEGIDEDLDGGGDGRGGSEDRGGVWSSS
jgi:hypothetical protein